MYIVNYNYIILYIYICLRIGDTLDLWRTRKGSGSTSDRYRMTQLILFLHIVLEIAGKYTMRMQKWCLLVLLRIKTLAS